MIIIKIYNQNYAIEENLKQWGKRTPEIYAEIKTISFLRKRYPL